MADLVENHNTSPCSSQDNNSRHVTSFTSFPYSSIPRWGSPPPRLSRSPLRPITPPTAIYNYNNPRQRALMSPSYIEPLWIYCSALRVKEVAVSLMRANWWGKRPNGCGNRIGATRAKGSKGQRGAIEDKEFWFRSLILHRTCTFTACTLAAPALLLHYTVALDFVSEGRYVRRQGCGIYPLQPPL